VLHSSSENAKRGFLKLCEADWKFSTTLIGLFIRIFLYLGDVRPWNKWGKLASYSAYA
jgi:hypothetical protein